jgi:hypothetical protein
MRTEGLERDHYDAQRARGEAWTEGAKTVAGIVTGMVTVTTRVQSEPLPVWTGEGAVS